MILIVLLALMSLDIDSCHSSHLPPTKPLLSMEGHYPDTMFDAQPQSQAEVCLLPVEQEAWCLIQGGVLVLEDTLVSSRAPNVDFAVPDAVRGGEGVILSGS